MKSTYFIYFHIPALHQLSPPFCGAFHSLVEESALSEMYQRKKLINCL